MAGNYDFLRGKITEKCGTQYKYAEKLGITFQELNRKLNLKSGFTQPQIEASIEILGLNAEETVKCFFSVKKIKKS